MTSLSRTKTKKKTSDNEQILEDMRSEASDDMRVVETLRRAV